MAVRPESLENNGVTPSVRMMDEDPSFENNQHPRNEGVLLDERFTKDLYSGETRHHELIREEIYGAEHRYWKTEPIAGKPQINITTQQGWCEIIEYGSIGWEVHKQLSTHMPEARIISRATEGIGQTATHIALRDLHDYGLDEMATNSSAFVTTRYTDVKSVLVGTSMGTVIDNKVMLNNISGNILGAIYYDLALVDPKQTIEAMGIQFVPLLAWDTLKELGFRTNPARLVGAFTMLLNSRPRIADGPALGKQGVDLLDGTSLNEIEAVLSEYRVAIIGGTNDSVAQLKMWKKLADMHPNLSLHPVQGRGHAMVLNPYKAARKIARTAVEEGFYVPTLRKVA